MVTCHRERRFLLDRWFTYWLDRQSVVPTSKPTSTKTLSSSFTSSSAALHSLASSSTIPIQLPWAQNEALYLNRYITSIDHPPTYRHDKFTPHSLVLAVLAEFVFMFFAVHCQPYRYRCLLERYHLRPQALRRPTLLPLHIHPRKCFLSNLFFQIFLPQIPCLFSCRFWEQFF